MGTVGLLAPTLAVVPAYLHSLAALFTNALAQGHVSVPRRPSSTAPITDSPTMTTIIIGIRQMIGNGDAQTEWHLVMATALLAILPSVAIVLAMQRWFLAGLIEPEKRRSVSESVQRRVESLSKRSNTATP